MDNKSTQRHRIYMAGAPGGGTIAASAHDFIAQSLGRDWKMSFLEATSIQEVVETFRGPNIAGGIVTMPWKKHIIPRLHYVDNIVHTVGACNHVSVNADSFLKGTNTDWLGIRDSLLGAQPPVSNDGGLPGLIIGAGGASRAAVYALANLGCKYIYIINRDAEEVRRLVQDVGDHENWSQLKVTHVQTIKQARLLPPPLHIVSTVPDFEPSCTAELEARGVYIELLRSKDRPPQATMLDMCYHPLQTRNLQPAKQHGWSVVNGVQVVRHQLRAQWDLWTGQWVDKQQEEAAWEILQRSPLSDPTVTTVQDGTFYALGLRNEPQAFKDPSNNNGFRSCHEKQGGEDPDSITSSPDFRILTTLQYHFLTVPASRNGLTATDTVDSAHLFKQWEAVNTKLLDLHARRLREAATALGWKEVAEQLSSHHNGSGLKAEQTEGQSPDCTLDLKTVIEEAAQRQWSSFNLSKESHPSSSLPETETNTPSARVRILVSRSCKVSIEFGPLVEMLISTLQQQFDTYADCPFTLSIPDKILSVVTLATRPIEPTLFTRYKTTHRTPYNLARQNANPPLQPTDLPTTREILLYNTNDEIMEASLSSVYLHRDGNWITPSTECGGMNSMTKISAIQGRWCVEGVVEKSSLRDGEVIWLSNAVRGFFPGVVKLDGESG